MLTLINEYISAEKFIEKLGYTTAIIIIMLIYSYTYYYYHTYTRSACCISHKAISECRRCSTLFFLVRQIKKCWHTSNCGKSFFCFSYFNSLEIHMEVHTYINKLYLCHFIDPSQSPTSCCFLFFFAAQRRVNELIE